MDPMSGKSRNSITFREPRKGGVNLKSRSRPSFPEASQDSQQLRPSSHTKAFLSYEPGIRLLEQALQLTSKVWQEWSFAVRAGQILANRYVLTLRRADIEGDPHQVVVRVWKQLRMPPAHIEIAKPYLKVADVIYFGFEEGETGSFYKVYLGPPIPPSELKVGNKIPAYGFKWDTCNSFRNTMSEYIWYPLLSLTEIRRRIDIIYGEKHQMARNITIDLLNFAGPRTKDLRYLQVSERSNPRKSFDLNFVDSRLRVSEVSPYLSKMWSHYRIAESKWRPLLESIGDKLFGHLSGGRHRDGQDFFNVYYERKRLY
jgi:hypothetical protein